MAKKGTPITFLTPGKKAPSLKTTITKPQNVFLENLSPMYMRSISSPAGSQLSEVITSVLSPKAEAKPEVIQPTVETSASKCASLKIRKEEGPKADIKHRNNLDLDEIESQIIPDKLSKVEDAENFLSTYEGYDVLSEFDLQPAGFTSGNRHSGVVVEGNKRRYTTSFCSSSSGDESVIAQSRSSLCDGCSSSTCNSSISLPVADKIQVAPNGDCSSTAKQQLDMTDVRIEALLDSHLTFEDLEPSRVLPKSQEAHGSLQLKDDLHQLSLSNEQMVFLLLRMVLSRYKQLTEDVCAEKKVNRSQRQSVACLIQAIVLLSRRVRSTSEQWRKTQLQLDLIKREHEGLRRHQRKIYIVVCVLLVFNLCNIQAVRHRILRIVKFFGVVENVRKINRFRKMVAENWRNIPSLLTDFWRIFIFRSSTRLKNT